MKRTLFTALMVLGGVILMQTIPSASGNLRNGNTYQDSFVMYRWDTIPLDVIKKYRFLQPFKLIEEDRNNWWGRPWWDGYAGYYKDSISAIRSPFQLDEPVRSRLFIKEFPRGYFQSFRTTTVIPPVKVDDIPFPGRILYPNIISDDGDFRMWYVINRNYSVEDSINAYHYSFGGIGSNVYIPRNYMHMYHAWGDLIPSFGTKHFDLDSAVRYFTHKEARRMFNADTVITYPFNMKQFKPRGRFLDKYTHLQIYVAQRNERGFLVMYCFTTDKGQRDFKKHFRALQKIFRYED